MQIALTGNFAAQLAFLGVRIQEKSAASDASLAADVLTSAAALTAWPLSLLTYKRSLRPLTILSLYLSASVLLGVARTRTLRLLTDNVYGSRAAVAITVCFFFSLVALILESTEKSHSTETWVAHNAEEKKVGAPEQYAGFWSRTSFSWLAATFRRGYVKVVSLDDLPILDAKLESHRMYKKLSKTWSKCEL